jgi:chromosome partitioning protein
VIDVDPQANLSVHLNVDIASAERTVYEVLTGEYSLGEAIRNVPEEGFDIVSSNINLAGAEIELVNQMGREVILRDAVNALDPNTHPYDFLLIDCPPSLGLLTVNALTAVDELFIPLQVQFFALQGISKLLDIIELVRKRLNANLALTGIIPVMFDQRTKLSHQVLDEIKSYFGKTVMRTIVRFNVRLAEAPSHGLTIFRYAPNSYGAQDYAALAKEVAKMNQEERAFRPPAKMEKSAPAARQTAAIFPSPVAVEPAPHVPAPAQNATPNAQPPQGAANSSAIAVESGGESVAESQPACAQTSSQTSVT